MRYLQTISEIKRQKLDVKDKKILCLLSVNARAPVTQIAKKVGLSRDAVQYRINKYESSGIVQGYRTLIDLSKLGYCTYHLFIKLNSPSKEIENRIISGLVKHNFVRAVINFNGNFDIEVAFVAKDTTDLDEKSGIILGDCQHYLLDYELLIISKKFVARTFSKSFIDYQSDKEVHLNLKHDVDKKDIAILKMIGDSAKIPLYEIADNVKLSIDAVIYRINKMIDSGLILKFIPVINYASLGYSLHALIVNIDGLDEKKEKVLKNFLTQDPNVLWAVKTIGKANLLLYVLVENIEDLHETSFKIKRLFPDCIRKYDSLIAYEEHKYIYFPKDLF